MNIARHYLRQWQDNPVREILAGAVATFALIPEVIAFSFTAGIDPAVGLYASFVISIVIALFGGRPAMISAAAGSVALVVAPLVREQLSRNCTVSWPLASRSPLVSRMVLMEA